MSGPTVRPLGFALGAEVTGIDLRSPLPPRDREAIYQAWLKHLVLVFPGQDLEPEELIDRQAAHAEGTAGQAMGMSPQHSAIWAAVAQLPPGQRAAVVLRFAVDLRYREVGEALGTSEEAARRNVHEGLKKLRASAGELKEMAK